MRRRQEGADCSLQLAEKLIAAVVTEGGWCWWDLGNDAGRIPQTTESSGGIKTQERNHTQCCHDRGSRTISIAGR